MRLIEKLIILLLGMSLIPFFVSGLLIYNSARRVQIDQIFRQLNAQATLQDHRLRSVNDQSIERINTLTSRPQLINSLDNFNKTGDASARQQMNEIVQSVKSAVPDFERLSIINYEGTTIVSTDPNEINKNKSNDNIFRKAQQDEATIGVFNKDRSGKLVRTMAGPININGKFSGAAIIETSSELHLSTVTDYTGLGATGETVIGSRLADGSIIYLAPLRFDAEAALSKTTAGLPVNEAVNGVEKNFYNAKDYRGHEIFAVSRYVDDTDQGIVVKIDKSEALQPVYKLRDQMLILDFMMLVAIIFLALVVARRTADPILAIDEIAEQVARGDLTKRVKVRSNDETANLAETFNDMLDNLESLDKLKSEFVSLASHQLRTPASGVKGLMSMLLEGYSGKLTAEQAKQLQKAYDANERQLRIISDLLDIAVIESGHMKINEADVDLAKIISDIASEMDSVIKSRSQTIDIKLPKNLPVVKGDPEKLRMVIDNLLSNASKFTRSGGKLSIDARTKGAYVQVVVADNGVGIAKKDIKKLFQKFSHVNRDVNVGHGQQFSSGIGLYLAKSIIDLHGGKIGVKSVQGKGSTFTVELPLKKA